MTTNNNIKCGIPMEDMRRTLMERAEAIFKVINSQSGPFPKSRLMSVGVNPEAAENWLDLIEYIQGETKIRQIKTGNNVIVEKIGN